MSWARFTLSVFGQVGAGAAGSRWSDPDLADDAAVAVLLGPVDFDLLAHHGARKALLRAVAEGLAFLRGVDAGEADLVLDVVAVQHGDRVAVGDADHLAVEDVGRGCRPDEGGQQGQKCGCEAMHGARVCELAFGGCEGGLGFADGGGRGLRRIRNRQLVAFGACPPLSKSFQQFLSRGWDGRA